MLGMLHILRPQVNNRIVEATAAKNSDIETRLRKVTDSKYSAEGSKRRLDVPSSNQECLVRNVYNISSIVPMRVKSIRHRPTLQRPQVTSKIVELKVSTRVDFSHLTNPVESTHQLDLAEE